MAIFIKIQTFLSNFKEILLISNSELLILNWRNMRSREKIIDLSWIGFPCKDSENTCGLGFIDFDFNANSNKYTITKDEEKSENFWIIGHDEEK